MEEKYYLAQKSCSLGLWESVLLSVDEENNVRFHRGHVNDKFEVDENGRPVCVTWDGISLPYAISGPLTEEQLKEWTSLGNMCWSGSSGKIRSVRRVF